MCFVKTTFRGEWLFVYLTVEWSNSLICTHMGLYMLFLRTCLAANLTSLVCASMYFKTLFLENTCLHPSLSYSFSFVYTLMMKKLTHKRKSLTTLVAIMFPFCIHFLKCLYKLTTIRGTHILCKK